MAKNFSHIKPIGQLDSMSCWAACLKWWMKAARKVTRSQKSIIKKYKNMRGAQNGLSNAGIEMLIVDHNMYIEVHDRASTFTSKVVKDLLRFGPLYTAYTETSTGQRHVNVIHGITGSGGGAQLTVMEPQEDLNKNMTAFVGKHKTKPLSEFNTFGTIFLGYD